MSEEQDYVERKYKFPRLAKQYGMLFRGGSSPEQAIINAESALSFRGVFNPLDKVVEVRQACAGTSFEATICYLHSKYSDSLTEIEKRRLKGVQTKLLVVDDNEASRTTRVGAIKGIGIYELSVCSDISEVVDALRDFTPELMIIRHDLSAGKASDVLQKVRQAGIRQKTIVYGNYDRQGAVNLYYKLFDVCYFLYLPHSWQFVEGIEKAINCVNAKTESEFFVP